MVISTQGKRSARHPLGFKPVLAIKLLPHLVEAVHGAGSIGIVGKRSGRELKRSGRQVVYVRNARVRNAESKSRSAGGEEFVVIVWESNLDLFCSRNAREERRGWSSRKRRRKIGKQRLA